MSTLREASITLDQVISWLYHYAGTNLPPSLAKSLADQGDKLSKVREALEAAPMPNDAPLEPGELYVLDAYWDGARVYRKTSPVLEVIEQSLSRAAEAVYEEHDDCDDDYCGKHGRGDN